MKPITCLHGPFHFFPRLLSASQCQSYVREWEATTQKQGFINNSELASQVQIAIRPHVLLHHSYSYVVSPTFTWQRMDKGESVSPRQVSDEEETLANIFLYVYVGYRGGEMRILKTLHPDSVVNTIIPHQGMGLLLRPDAVYTTLPIESGRLYMLKGVARLCHNASS